MLIKQEIPRDLHSESYFLNKDAVFSHCPEFEPLVHHQILHSLKEILLELSESYPFIHSIFLFKKNYKTQDLDFLESCSLFLKMGEDLILFLKNLKIEPESLFYEKITQNKEMSFLEISPDLFHSSQTYEFCLQYQIQSLIICPVYHASETHGYIIFPLFEASSDLIRDYFFKLQKDFRYLSFAFASFFSHLDMLHKLDYMEKRSSLLENLNNRLKQEFDLARKLQSNLLPSQPPVFPSINISFIYKPLEAVGGDFYSFMRFKEQNLLGIFLSDVSGHGVSAAMVTSMMKILLDNAGMHRLSPSRLFEYLNERLNDEECRHYLTAFYGIYDNETKKLKYAQAGHPFPILLRDGEMMMLEGKKNNMIGLFRPLNFYEQEIQLYSGDKLIFFTDGLTDAKNPKRERFKPDFLKFLKSNSHLSVEPLVQKLYHEVLTFSESYHLEDDLCIIGTQIQ
ncbi:MAG TPA: hypothetical protein DHW82_08265 [Spirochaetia bacterium]|nr:MAG: hypothetical protein A2Y41_14005 [Spirochaetes bacterium GWB1_36_13]HCL56987.1 hypothetical protein [Spirochaetia bacterium]